MKKYIKKYSNIISNNNKNIFYQKAKIVIIIFMFCSIKSSLALDFFYCETPSFLNSKDTIVKLESYYYFNFIKNSKDSVVIPENETNIKEIITIEITVKNQKLNGAIKYYIHDSLL